MGSPQHGWIVAAGCYDLAFAAFHTLFPLIFRWNERLAPLDAVNRGILRTLNIMLSLVFVAIGLTLVLVPGLVASDRLGSGLLLAGAVFWLVRGALQAPMFGLGHPWSRALVAIFGLGAVLHAVPFWP